MANENINEAESPALLVGAVICSACGGYGYTIEVKAECCGNYKEYGCCGVPNPVQVQVESKNCKQKIGITSEYSNI
jgi:hypothetical protein